MLSTYRLGQQKCDPCVKKCVENAPLSSQSQLRHPPTYPWPLSYSCPLPPHSTFILPSPVALEVDGNIVNFNLIVLLPLPSRPPPDP